MQTRRKASSDGKEEDAKRNAEFKEAMDVKRAKLKST